MFISLIVALPLWGFLIVWKVYTRFVKKGTDKENEKVSQEEEGVNLKAKIFDEPVWNGLRKRNTVLYYFVSCFSTILPQIKCSQFLIAAYKCKIAIVNSLKLNKCIVCKGVHGNGYIWNHIWIRFVW